MSAFRDLFILFPAFRLCPEVAVFAARRLPLIHGPRLLTADAAYCENQDSAMLRLTLLVHRSVELGAFAIWAQQEGFLLIDPGELVSDSAHFFARHFAPRFKMQCRNFPQADEALLALAARLKVPVRRFAARVPVAGTIAHRPLLVEDRTPTTEPSRFRTFDFDTARFSREETPPD